MSQGVVKVRTPTGSNSEPQVAGSAMSSTFTCSVAAMSFGLAFLRDHLEEREVGDRRDEAAGEDDRLAADLVRQPAEEDEERRADEQREGDQEVRRRAVDLQGLGQEEQGVELAGVPDHRLPGRAAEKSDKGDLGVLPAAERFL